MGILETLSGRKKVLSFEIIFNDKNKVGVIVNKNVPIIPTPDYIRVGTPEGHSLADRRDILGGPSRVAA